ncbi:MAG: phosphoribosylamine--glycine ligase [Verrucomicrobiota bacterium JB022]|nr:phosphoribosylamine--glycine ligase [Verrucomicrobiota bacterium JB022]
MEASQWNVLVIGSGGREHALVKACLASPRVANVVAAPGNAGMALEAECRPVDAEDAASVLALAAQMKADLVIVGPEAPLAVGVGDALRAAGFNVYGPDKDGATLEASKVYCKEILARYEIPTAAYAQFTDPEAARDYLATASFPLVVKASGLAAGKGVVICEERSQAEAAIQDMMVEAIFGDSGREVVIEEFLRGEEASMMVMVSGEKFVCLPVSQDHKRAGEGDTGPNTGGMGAYAPAAVVTPELQKQIEETIIRPTLAGLVNEGIDYRGTLYIGLMLTEQGPKVLEFNVRFGDPECQVLLPLCETDPVELMMACADGTLQPEQVKIKDAYAMIVVHAAAGYPGSYPKGDEISLPAPEALPPQAHIIHAGVRANAEGHLVTNGGRVLGVVAQGPTLQAAADLAYQVSAEVSWKHHYYRKDIAWRQLQREG